MVEKSQALQAASGASVTRLEETQEAYKGSVVALQERLEASVNEINRGNAIIQKLQGHYRALRSKAKLKSEVIKQQVRTYLIVTDPYCTYPYLYYLRGFAMRSV